MLKNNILSHKELIEYGCKFLKRRNYQFNMESHYGPCCTRIFKELVTAAGEVPDVIGFRGSVSYLIEAKTSLSDFYSDRLKPWRCGKNSGMGNFRYYISQKGIIPVNKIPDNWGLLEIIENKIYMTKDAKYVEADKKMEIVLLLSWIRRVGCDEDISMMWAKYAKK